MESKIGKAYQYLFDNAQPIVRYEAAAALGQDSEGLRLEMVNHPQVQYWIECSQRFMSRPQIHNSADTCLENWMHKLLSFGIREADDERLSEVNSFILQYVNAYKDKRVFRNTINSTITASWLACMGYEDQIITDLLRERIEVVHEFTKERNYDIYVSPEGFPAIPKERAVHPLVNPKLYENEVWKLPTVHDIFAFANLPPALRNDRSAVKKIDDIIQYILDERYQRLNRGYGLMLVYPDKYYSMGWSVHLDHYFESNGRLSIDGVIWAMELMSHFKAARESDWFKRTLQHLELFENDGLYEFPSQYVSEGKDKYYVGGGHMGLGENRRVRQSLKIESTAWMMRILKMVYQER